MQLIILGHFSDYVFFRFIDAEKKDVLERASLSVIYYCALKMR